ncbi:S-layer homology domain-containing protein [Paenibacillus sp. M1]|uniref:S-layer homology domain-containing protein n=2 Tax=Paenibacillus TaxID=44249 RepID=A0A3P3UBE1_9BACL|nr:S-layer homology domain-containing protein [Paenibacillus oralis]RRJ67474.1 S-layer homology domain-containing protein [Paenibacillus oralis]
MAAWAEPYINQFIAQGFLQGDEGGRIRPMDPITWAEFATLLVRYLRVMETVRFARTCRSVAKKPLRSISRLRKLPGNVTAANTFRNQAISRRGRLLCLFYK